VLHGGRDPLTGLGTWKQLHQRWQEDADSARAGGALILLGLDGMHHINNTYGRKAGNNVVARTGKLIRRLAPRRCGYRIGGDWFVLVLSDTQPEAARGLAELLREQIAFENAGLPIPESPRTGRLTATVGVLVLDKRSRDLNPVLRSVDRLISDFRQNGGGDRVFVGAAEAA
jgi:diguanylate cyclase (GGDEF)-like protein